VAADDFGSGPPLCLIVPLGHPRATWPSRARSRRPVE
jgi:hypothetical protein